MKRSRLRTRSKKYDRAQRELAGQIPDLVARSHGSCEARFSRWCTGGGAVPHHILGRAHARYKHDPRLILWTCAVCNSAIEDEPTRALSEGLKIRSWEPEALARWCAEQHMSVEAADQVFGETVRQAWQSGRSFQAVAGVFRAAYERVMAS